MAMALVGGTALAVRLLYVWLEWNFDVVDGSFYSGDAGLYDTLAGNLAAGRGFTLGGEPTAYVVPGYPLWLAFWYSTVGRNFAFIGAVQSLLGAMACVFVYLVGARVFDRTAALVAGLFCALLPEFVLWTSGQILTEPLYVFLLTASVFLMVLLLPVAGEASGGTTNWAVAAGAGIMLGMAALTRPTALAFGILACVYIWKAVGWRRAILVATGVALFFVPWTIRNARVMGGPLITSTDAGWVLYMYHSPETPAENGGYDPHLPRRSEAAGLSELEQARFYTREAASFAVRNPGREVVLSTRRFWNTFRPTYEGSSARNRLISSITYVPFALFALAGLLAVGFRNPAIRLLALFVLFHVAFHTFVAGELRFRIPMIPVLALFSAASLVWVWVSFFPRARSRAGLSAAPAPGGETRELLVSVIVPAYNEADRIESVLRRIAAVPVRKEVIVINDGSTDRTGAVLDGLAELFDARCDLAGNMGKGSAVLAGLESARGDLVLVQDADGELDPGDYPRLLAPFSDRRVQAVFGSRFLPAGSEVRRTPVSRLMRAANWFITGFANLLFGTRLTDVETGFKVCRRGLLRSLALRPSRYEFEPELTGKLLRRGIQIIEVPVSYFPRPRSEKQIGFRDGIAALRELARLRLQVPSGSPAVAIDKPIAGALTIHG